MTAVCEAVEDYLTAPGTFGETDPDHGGIDGFSDGSLATVDLGPPLSGDGYRILPISRAPTGIRIGRVQQSMKGEDRDRSARSRRIGGAYGRRRR